MTESDLRKALLRFPPTMMEPVSKSCRMCSKDHKFKKAGLIIQINARMLYLDGRFPLAHSEPHRNPQVSMQILPRQKVHCQQTRRDIPCKRDSSRAHPFICDSSTFEIATRKSWQTARRIERFWRAARSTPNYFGSLMASTTTSQSLMMIIKARIINKVHLKSDFLLVFSF